MVVVKLRNIMFIKEMAKRKWEQKLHLTDGM